jgi:ATP-binding cassette subfamily B protein
MKQESTAADTEFTGKKELWPFIKRIFTHSFTYPRWSVILIATSALVSIIDGILPIVWYRYIDDFVTPISQKIMSHPAYISSPEIWKGWAIFAGIYIGLNLIQIIGTYALTLFAGKIKDYVIYDLRKLMFHKLQYLSYSYFDKSALGWLSIRLTSDVDKVSEVISFGFVSMISGVMMITVSLIAMFFYHWKLALIVVVSIPIMILLSIRIRILILKYSRKARKIYSHMAAFLTESINGIEVNKATVHEQKSIHDFDTITEDLRKTSFMSSFYTALYNPVIVISGSFVAAFVIYLGGLDVMNQTGFTLGLLAAFFGYARMIFEPIMEITRFYAAAQDSMSAGERIFSLIDEKVTIKNNPSDIFLLKPKGNIRFQNVHFHYTPDKPVLKGLNIDITAGQSVALVGPTGEGKSTIAHLIGRFYEPITGKILIDNIDYTTIDLFSYRQELGIVLQTPYLFSGTVEENIRYGKINATTTEIQHVLLHIGANRLANHLQLPIGEEGHHLSAGEKQLMAMARVLIKNPSIVILDEATASLDTRSELIIQKAIHTLLQNRTSIIIAHRLSTIIHCDVILVIKDGRIFEKGNHRELIEKKGYYYQLYQQSSYA